MNQSFDYNKTFDGEAYKTTGSPDKKRGSRGSLNQSFLGQKKLSLRNDVINEVDEDSQIKTGHSNAQSSIADSDRKSKMLQKLEGSLRSTVGRRADGIRQSNALASIMQF